MGLKDRFKRLPQALQRQVAIRLAAGAGFILLFLAVQLGLRDIYLSLPCLLFGSVMIVNGGLLFYNGVKGNFIRVQGICRQVETAGIRKRIWNIYIGTELYTIKMSIRHRIRKLDKGDTVIVYLSEKTPVYEQENGYMVCSYYALEIGREV